MSIELRPYADPEHQPFEFGEGIGSALLIHGFPGTPAEMRPIGQALGEIGWRARGILLPGFGPDIVNLDRRGREDWLQAAKAAWLDLHAPNHPSVIIGYSMGAAVALNLVSDHPPDLLILISPFWMLSGFLPKLVPLAKWLVPELYPFKNADFTDPNLLDQFNSILPGVDLGDPQIQDTIRTGFKLPLQTIDEILRLGREAYRRAHRVDVPTLVIQGNADPLVRPAKTKKLIRRIGAMDVKYHEINGGHNLVQNGSVTRSQVVDLILQRVNRLR